MSDPSELQRRLAEAVARDDTVEPLLDPIPDELVLDLVDDEPVIDLRARTAPANDELLDLVLNRARYQRVGVSAVGAEPDSPAPLAELAQLKARHHRRNGEPTVLDLVRLVPPRPKA